MKNAVAITFWQMALLGHFMDTSLSLSDNKNIVIVTKSCPETLTEQGDIIILADHTRTHPVALCQRQHKHLFHEIAIAVYRLQFKLNGDWKRHCIAMLQTTGDYQIEIKVPSEGPAVIGQSHILNVTCPSPQLINSTTIDTSTNRTAQSWQNTSDLFNQLKTEEEILLMDDASFGTESEPIILSVHYEVEGNWALITLSAMLIETQTSAKGITPVWCLAHYRRSKIVILDNGCGNGTVIPKISGFHVASYISWSPVFKLPLHSGQSPLEIECQFGLCKDKCDGFSCRGIPVTTVGSRIGRIKLYLTSRLPGESGVTEIIPAGRSPTYGLAPSVELDNRPSFPPPTPTRLSPTVTVILILLLPAFLFLVATGIWCRFFNKSAEYNIGRTIR